MKKEPSDVPLAPVGTSPCFEDRSSVCLHLLDQEGHWNAIGIERKEQVESTAPRPTEGSCSGEPGCKSPLQAHVGEHGEHLTMRIIQEEDEARTPLPCDGSDDGDADGPSTSHEPVNEAQGVTVAVEQEPVDAAENCLEEDTGPSSSQEQFGKRQEGKEVKPGQSVPKSSIIRHERTHIRKRPLSCNVCQMTFTTSSALYLHAVTHTVKAPVEKRPFSCNICKETFSTVCPKTFDTKLQLAYDKCTHTNERPFRCPICSKAYQFRAQLTQHVTTHSEESTVKCPICFIAFKSKYYLSYHEKTHNYETIFRCSRCPEVFQCKDERSAHEATHMSETFFKVPAPSGSFERRQSPRIKGLPKAPL
ncbi:unnamed protein product [Ixodes pacificus]